MTSKHKHTAGSKKLVRSQPEVGVTALDLQTQITTRISPKKSAKRVQFSLDNKKETDEDNTHEGVSGVEQVTTERNGHNKTYRLKEAIDIKV